ncbi:PREDICTED: monoglyceride lipase-like [Amphimedon queenslandica]|uniref:Serine aminopeptidase S33 domain-containing protein n=1 Tax=Amphimedon queenslandica TaxID=400682 RepID=A0A1X7VRP7_AMPQE|nr:PREDICTED: monoglyceride lipase-like [Amphimedon queenslandica]|eukprot:XP_003383097.1 PREDICTED: monoglyceride lipase-like [Amphimedon queenslandica]
MATTSEDLKEVPEGETASPEDPKKEGQSDQTSNSEVIATSGTNETSDQDQPNVDANTDNSDVNQPNADTDQPNADADQPNADTDQPNADADQPNANTDQPNADADLPNTNADANQPNANADADQPNADADQPNTDANQPNADADQPNADANQPNADANQPNADADQPNADADPPNADADPPNADADQPNADADQDPKEDTRRRSVYCNQPLETYIWKPEAQDIKGLVCICHGVHEHMGRYEKLAEHLKSSGLLVFGIDLVGHGKSEGVRGSIDDMQSYATDVIGFAQEMEEKYPEQPMFLMGHSMGGLVATIVAIQRQSMFIGLLLSAPSLMVDPNEAGPIKRLLARIIGAIAPNFGISTLNTSTISSLPEEVAEYVNDPLIIHAPLKAGWGLAFMKGIQYVEGRLGDISIPLFIMHGSDDQLVPMAASELVHNNASSTDKTLEVFIDCRHEILHDKEQDRARQLISTWILSRITSKQETAPDN